MKPFEINTTGRAEISLPAERAVINVSVSSSGGDKAWVSEEVLTTTKHIEDLLREYAPKGDSPEAKQAAALAHWSKTSLSATSYIPYSNGKPKARKYDAKVDFDIRFKDFKALGSFGSKLSALEHTETRGVDWILTDVTWKSYVSRLRKEAARDALVKAQDYCEVLGCINVRPVNLTEDDSATFTNRRYGGVRMSTMAVQSPGMMRQRSMATNEDRRDNREELSLEFKPEEVKMSHSVTVQFHADAATGDGSSSMPLSKRRRIDDDSMDDA